MNPTLLALAAIGWLAVAGGGAVLALTAARQRKVRLRLEAARGRMVAAQPGAADGVHALPARLVAGLGHLIARSGVLPGRTLNELEQTLTAAGLRGANGLAVFVGAKIMLFIGLPMLAFVALHATSAHPPAQYMMMGGAALVGLLAPDYTVRQVRARHLAALQRGLPDALDLMVICAQAGLGLETAIARVAEEVHAAHPAIAREFEATSRELQITAESRLALESLARRTGLDSVKRFAATLTQSLHYGTPLVTALRTLSGELRQEALTRFEERAARLPVMLTLPMVVFILPCVFIVVGGPAVLRIMAALHHA
ncbi:MAG: type II secretion system F family protein [Rhodospirillales bacterium]|jgi:tight adherence protein C|nr:type II secretion system F family protein [Rhodospirillales bacterium]